MIGCKMTHARLMRTRLPTACPHPRHPNSYRKPPFYFLQSISGPFLSDVGDPPLLQSQGCVTTPPTNGATTSTLLSARYLSSLGPLCVVPYRPHVQNMTPPLYDGLPLAFVSFSDYLCSSGPVGVHLSRPDKPQENTLGSNTMTITQSKYISSFRTLPPALFSLPIGPSVLSKSGHRASLPKYACTRSKRTDLSPGRR